MDWAAIDVSNVVWWKFHSTARRDPLLAVIQAVTHVPVLCDELGCERVAFCHDRAPYKRRQVWPQYKTHRDKHPGEDSSAEDELRAYIAKIPDYLRLLGYRNVFARPGYEADDLMWAVRQAVPAADRLVMVSGDGDLFQLLDGRTASYRPRTGHGWMTARQFKSDYGVHPRLWVEVKCLAGDGSDFIPGLDGVGVKTACKFFAGRLAGTPTHARLLEFNRTPEYARNRRLIALPFPGVGPVELHDDLPYPMRGWKPLGDRLGLAIDGSVPHARNRELLYG